MKLRPITLEFEKYPSDLQPYLRGAKLFDSSSSAPAQVVFVDKGSGFFLKSAPKGALKREADMTRYFYGKGLSAEALFYISDETDWLLTAKIHGDDCLAAKYLEQPERLTDTLAERLALLHSLDSTSCPVPDHTKLYLAKADYNRRSELFDKSLFPDNWGYASAEEAWSVVERQGHLLKSDTLLHGDYCLPNIILDDWRFGGFIDLDNAGVGDRNVDVFWAVWSLFYNLKTDRYRDRFIDAYGRGKVDEDMLRVIAAVEVFG
jgi:kanamycin kinase